MVLIRERESFKTNTQCISVFSLDSDLILGFDKKKKIVTGGPASASTHVDCGFKSSDAEYLKTTSILCDMIVLNRV